MVIDTEWYCKAHNLVFCNWLVMSFKQKLIRRFFFGGGGLAMSPKNNQDKKKRYTKHIDMEQLKNL